MPYSNACKECNYKWQSDEVSKKCPNCGATGSQAIGFAFVEGTLSETAANSGDTSSEPESISLEAGSQLDLKDSASDTVNLDVTDKET